MLNFFKLNKWKLVKYFRATWTLDGTIANYCFYEIYRSQKTGKYKLKTKGWIPKSHPYYSQVVYPYFLQLKTEL